MNVYTQNKHTYILHVHAHTVIQSSHSSKLREHSIMFICPSIVLSWYIHLYVLASKVVIMAGLVAADSPATPLLRAATNKEYVVPD